MRAAADSAPEFAKTNNKVAKPKLGQGVGGHHQAMLPCLATSWLPSCRALRPGRDIGLFLRGFGRRCCGRRPSGNLSVGAAAPDVADAHESCIHAGHAGFGAARVATSLLQQPPPCRRSRRSCRFISWRRRWRRPRRSRERRRRGRRWRQRCWWPAFHTPVSAAAVAAAAAAQGDATAGSVLSPTWDSCAPRQELKELFASISAHSASSAALSISGHYLGLSSAHYT
uniref:Uncharacterized protein n=1 Tax=Macrostomum lignano TaxID=282301 RepID=A0A1I8F7V1_9PLAT